MRKTERKDAPIIVSWIGQTDIDIMSAWRVKNGLRAAPGARKRPNLTGEEAPGENGPIRTFTDGREAKIVWLLASGEFENAAEMVAAWVRRGTKAECRIFFSDLKNPASYAETYQATERFFREHWNGREADRYLFNITPGTPATQAVLFYAAHARHPGGEVWRVAEKRHAVDGEQCFREDLPFHIPAGALGDGPPADTVVDRPFQDILTVYAPVRIVNILLLGETGTGKSLHAGRIHRECYGTDARFEHVNCAEISAGDGTLFRSALFGHVRGAFTGADRDRHGAFRLARGGTLFLDEVGEIPLHLQGVLLRCLQERIYLPVGSDKLESIADVRIIAATNRNLLEDVRAGRFREDLYYRLAMCVYRMPPLREISAKDGARFLEIVDGLLKDAARRDPVLDRPWSLSREATRILRTHGWPGNVREMGHVLLLACIHAGHDGRTELRSEDVIPHLFRSADAAAARPSGGHEDGDWLPAEGLEEWLRLKKIELINRALRLTGGRKAEASRLLGQSKHYLNNAFNSVKLGLSRR